MEEKRTQRVSFGIQLKLILCIIPVFVLTMAVIILIAYHSSRDSILKKTQSLMEAEGNSVAGQVISWQGKNLSVLETSIKDILSLKLTDEEILSHLTAYLKVYEDFPNGIYITKENNTIIDAAGWEPDILPTEGTWYKEGMEHSEFSFGVPYLDTYTNEYIVTASRRLDSLNGMTAVAAADVSLSILSDVIKQMEVDDGGQAFIFDSDTGIILAHQQDALTGTRMTEAEDDFYQKVAEDIGNGKFDKQSYQSGNRKCLTNISAIEGTKWYIVLQVPEKNILSDLERIRLVLSGVGIAMGILICIFVGLFIGAVINPVKRITGTIVGVTEGDFTQEVQVRGHDEVSVMAAGMRRFIGGMRETLKQIAAITENLSEKAENSNQLSSKLFQAAKGQSEGMEQLDKIVKQLAQAIVEIAENATSLADIVKETEKEGNLAVENMSETTDAAREGQSRMEKVSGSMTSIGGEVETLGRMIEEIGEAAEKIDTITHTISEIAEETNLLSLNASIEAARAGEAGRGFAIVAGQIKKLAETSSDAASEISQLIASVTRLMKGTAEQSQENLARVREGIEMSEEASMAFGQIYEKIRTTGNILDSMMQKMRQVDDVSVTVASITQEQSAAAEEIESTSYKVTALARNVTKNSREMAEDSQELFRAAEELKKKTVWFKVK